jgi:hypothetical protein
MRRRAGVSLGAGLLAVLVMATSTAGAGPTRLRQGTVTPAAGTTTTSFAFSVDFVGSPTDQATSVIVSAAGGSVPLSLTSGTPDNGTWTGSSTLPAGSWTVTYQATRSGGADLALAVPTQVVVTAPTPPPTPQPTLAPTPMPTPRPAPTATPRPGTTPLPNVSPTPFGTTVTDPTGSPPGTEPAASPRQGSASPSPTAAPAAADPADTKRPLNVPVEGVVAIGLLGAVAAAAALGERRRRRAVEAFRAAAESGETPVDRAAPGGQGLPEGWEDDETVGSIEYETPDHLREPSDELASDASDEPAR